MSVIGTDLKKHNGFQSDSGQAALEYLLVLLITVILIGTALYQFSTAFRAYANAYFGDYIACLIETGELPGVTAGECADAWRNFSLADGKPAFKDLNGGGSGAGGNSGGSASSSPSSKSTNPGGGASSSSTSSSSSPSGETVGLSTPGDTFGGGKSGTRRSTPIRSSADNSSKGREGLRPIGSVANSSSDDVNGRGRRTALTGTFGYAGQKEDEDRTRGRPGTKAVGQDDSGRLRPKKVAVDADRKPAALPDDGGGFTIGSFIRILLIAAILIAIFILFGGQLLAISKSGEK